MALTKLVGDLYFGNYLILVMYYVVMHRFMSFEGSCCNINCCRTCNKQDQLTPHVFSPYCASCLHLITAVRILLFAAAVLSESQNASQ
jgi:hypothetical protein